MAIRVALHHQTTYRYDRPVRVGPQIVRLRPAPHSRTPVVSYSLRVSPSEHFLNWQQDPQSNWLARVVVPERTRTLAFEVDLVAELTVVNPFDFFLDQDAERFPIAYEPWLRDEIHPFLQAPAPGPRLAAWLASVNGRGDRTIDVLVDLNRRLKDAIRYVVRMEPGVQTCEETLAVASGSCRDSAWLLVQILRNLGLAARFVSGYLIQLAPDVRPLTGPPGPAADFTDLHAWAEVYLPGAGWIGLDPTSGLLAGEGHIPLACTPDPASAAPLSGAVDACDVAFDFRMSIERVHEDPRVTRPYREEEWRRIDALGQLVDTSLDATDVRLTMGGEPTFVAIDDPEGPEWTTTALGAGKRRRAGILVRRLRDRFAPRGLLHFGQGKWYPGESLPRWALGLYWRTDGAPVWEDPALVADDDRDQGMDVAAAERFVRALAARLEVDVAHALPGYEDNWYYLWRERRLPVNVDPFTADLHDPEERARLARIFERGLDAAVGWALPLTPGGSGGGRWRSGPWFFRPERLYLTPGDSPMGFRLPLDSLPWAAAADLPRPAPLDPFAVHPPLPPRAPRAPWTQARLGPAVPPHGDPWGPLRERRRGNGHGKGNGGDGDPSARMRAPLPGESASWIVRTALCVEPRDGRLHVFMPPLDGLVDYLDLIAAVEATAAALGAPVLIEGYQPPADPRLRKLEVTPDPGVIEVNVHPAHGWDELVTTTTALYEEARHAALGTEKFMIDGRHTGTGGGNHLVVGGATAADSPILRRPDLLRSLVGYWHNHPGLSYLFSGLCIGPTSQAPRVDEARNDQVHELEIACAQVPDAAAVPPWLVDRVFRNVLIDVTGNTHRTEFCIDKLYAPESARGRLGLLELRAFEMPPHPHMSLVQQLLLRALIARFWEVPYAQRLERWGTALHDRFLLPHFVERDVADVVRELGEAGFPFERAWLDPHFAFRFPPIGTVAPDGVVLELRHALEPWHVMGEEPAAGGTVRYVDSSLERLQVRAAGLVEGRHVITCNGHRVPLHPTGVAGELVAGVRFRAWQPPSCLHPTIGVHTPLVFDVVDAWRGRSIGGCTYHVAHPGGRAYDTFPVNAGEAEARRAARFVPFGHTPGPMAVAPHTVRDLDFPLTLDLRRAGTGLGR